MTDQPQDPTAPIPPGPPAPPAAPVPPAGYTQPYGLQPPPPAQTPPAGYTQPYGVQPPAAPPGYPQQPMGPPPQPPAAPKKSIFRRWWFWVTAVVIVAIIGGAASSGNKKTPDNAAKGLTAQPESRSSSSSSSSSSSDPSTDDSSDPSPTSTEAKIGDSISLESNDDGGKISVKLIKVVTNDKPSSGNYGIDKPSKGKRYVSIQWLITNTGTTVYDDSPTNGSSVTSSADEQYDSTLMFSDTRAGHQFAGSIKIRPGHRLIGVITYEVPIKARIVTAQFSEDSGFADTGEWQLHK